MGQVHSNTLLATLPQELRCILLPILEPIALPIATVLYEPEKAPYYVHFLTSGLASIVTYMQEGEAVEVGIVGLEGFPESLHLLGPGLLQTKCFMQIAGTGLRIKFRDFEQLFKREEALRSAVLRFVQYQSLVLGQIAACNRIHEVEERLARWLLMVSDRTGESELALTHEFVSEMLGTRRPTVTQVAGTLKRGGLIEYSPGLIRILDREGLEKAACECYRVASDALQRLTHQASLLSFPP